jgi:hypothetical protein
MLKKTVPEQLQEEARRRQLAQATALFEWFYGLVSKLAKKEALRLVDVEFGVDSRTMQQSFFVRYEFKRLMKDGVHPVMDISVPATEAKSSTYALRKQLRSVIGDTRAALIREGWQI